MILMLISMLLAWTPFAQELKDIGFDVRAKQSLLMGKGATTNRFAMTEDFGLPAEVTTVVEILSGGTTSVGAYTIADQVNPGDKFDEPINKTSSAEIDKYVTPLSRKTITLDIRPGPQSISIVGQMLIISRGTTTTRVDTPGTRIATVSNFKFQEAPQGTTLR
jgi:hypothetical protein